LSAPQVLDDKKLKEILKVSFVKNEKSKNAFPDRANLLPEQSTRLEAWVKQVNLSSLGAL
jgi:hypothetical protein